MGATVRLFWQMPIVGLWNFGMWVCIIWRKTIVACKIQRQSLTGRLTDPLWRDFFGTLAYNDTGRRETESSDGVTKDTTRLFHGPWPDHADEYIGNSICAESFGMGNSLRDYRFYASVTNISKRKSDAYKQNFERTLNLTWKVKVNQPLNKRDLKQVEFLAQIWRF